jgi:hypothetical protein
MQQLVATACNAGRRLSFIVGFFRSPVRDLLHNTLAGRARCREKPRVEDVP